MQDSKSTSIPHGGQFELTKEEIPMTAEEKEEMEEILYAMALGCLMYVMVSTRPDITHAFSILSRFMSNPGINHWRELKWLLRYLRGTSDIGFTYKRISEKVTLKGYVDAYYASSKDTRRSTTSYVFQTNGDCISWKSQLQSVVALSTTKVEFMVTTKAFKEAIWLQRILKELKLLVEKARVHSDSQSSIHLCKNPVYHEKTKHNDIQFFWIREKIEVLGLCPK
ncbi:secreted RxLR effector protein 161-like [Cannabis sativa]|uniref:secreted RxLR effector protein 161-like n=1 Tax=Cannabis sativa TaxID=3483 RepID=UPI0029CA6F6C|nr:secreted RxLR effector protein 161-like [Cannabis sativa]